MMLLIPIPVNNAITGVEEDTTVALVVIDLISMATIEENKENGYGDIFYKTGTIQETKVPFIALVKFFMEQGIVNSTFAELCTPISNQMNSLFNKSNTKI